MAAEGIAKRATIGVGFHTNQDAINAFEHSLRTIGEDTSKLRDTFSRTNHVMDRFNEHMSSFTGHYRNSMNSIREANRQAVESMHHVSNALRNSTDTYNHNSDKFSEADRRIIESERQKFENVAENEHKINERLSQTATDARHSEHALEQQNKRLRSKLSSVGNASTHTSNRVASANGRMAHSFRYANDGINRHIQSIRDAQNHDYHWLRTAQAMSLTSLGLGVNLYRGAKDVGTLQQSYLHAGNMAHYGGEKIATVQHHINDQWRVGSQLSIKYGVSQDQIAKGFQALVARGYKTNEALHAQAPLLQAAIASGDSYNDVVQGTTNVLDAYNLRSDNAAKMTNHTKEVTDEMAYAADQTASNFKDLSTGMAYVAATAHTTNQPISETSSALGILSNKGMQASMAGVGLRKVLNSFLSINKKGQQAQVMKQLGLNQNSFRTASGHLKSLGQLMTILNNKTKNMGSAERGAIFHRFFGATGQEAALNLASDTSGLKQLNDQVKRSQDMGKNHQGYVSLLSAHNMKSAQNQFNVFKQAWQAFMITSAREVLPTFTNALKHADVYLAKMNDLSPHAKKWTIFGALAVAAISPISYAIFGIQSAFHGVEMTLLHVRRLFARPVSNNMSNSAYKNAVKQEDVALAQNADTGRSAYMNKLGQTELDHPHLTQMRLRRQRLGARIWASNRGALSHITNIGGDYRFKPGMTSYEKMVAKPAMLARVNPFNKSARLFTHRFTSWIPGVHRLPAVTGRSASYLLRGSGVGAMSRLGGSLLGKANLVTGIATALPFVEKTLKWIDHTRIGGKIFAPFNKSLIKGMNGPVKFIDRSWNFIKRGALDAIKPIENEWHKMFSNQSKSSRANLRGIKEFVHISTGLIGGLFRTIAKVAGNLLKYGGHAIAGVMKALRGVGTLVGAVADVFTGHWKRAWYLFKHGANITLSGVWNTFSALFKGVATSAGDVLNGIWTSIKHVAKLIAPPFISAWHVIKKSAVNTWHDMIDPIADFYHTAVHAAHGVGNAFVNEFESMRDRLDGIIGDIESRISSIGSDLAHPIKSAEHFVHSHASGGAIDHTEMSLVNEKGQESAYNPQSNTFRLLGNNGPQVLKLYQGEHVLNAQDTRELLTTGLGRGVTLPGYANGTDKLNSLKPINGYAVGTGRAGAISSEESSEPHWMQNVDSNLFKTGVQVAAPELNMPHDIWTNRHNPLKAAGSALLDLPAAKLMSGTKLYRPLNRLQNSPLFKHMAAPARDMVSSLEDKIPLHHYIGKLGRLLDPDTLNKNFKRIKPYLHGIVGFGKKFGENMLHSPILHGLRTFISHPLRTMKQLGNRLKTRAKSIGKNFGRFGRTVARKAGQAWRSAKRMGRNALRGIHSFGSRALRGAKRIGSRAWRGIRRFGRGTMRFGRKLFRGGKRLLSRAGRDVARFGRHTWSRARRLGRHLWSGTKRVARRVWSTTKRTAGKMWRSAKRTSRNIWNNTKRVARNVGRAARSLWNRTKRGASNTWTRVVSGASKMASRVKNLGSRAWSAIKDGAREAKSVADSMLSGILSFAHRVAHAIKNVVTLGGLIGHHANGGAITHNELSLVGEHGPETAYNARTGAVRLLGLHGPQITTLLAGERVLTNTQTSQLLHGGLGQKLPSFAKGTGEVLDNSSYHPSRAMTITGLFSGTSALNKMRDFSKKAKSIWDDITGYTTKETKDTHSANNDEWSDMAKDLGKINDDLSKDTRDSFSDMGKKVGKLVDDMHSGLVSSAEDMATGFGDKFKKLIDYAKHDMESVIDKLNKGVRGIDVALRAFGGNSHVIHEIHYATGSGFLTHNQIGILNDATSGPRQESILRNGQLLFPHGNDVRVPLHAGDAVLNGNQTKEISNITNVNHYASGSGLHLSGKLISGITKVLGEALKGPKKFFEHAFDHTIGNPSGHQLTKGIEQMGISAVKPLGVKWTRAMFSFIKNLLSPDNNSGGSSNSVLLNEMHKLGDGHTYLWGAAGPTHYDCGGLVMAALHHLGMPSEHTIYPYPRIPAKDATTGDIVQSATHVGVVADPHAKTYFSAYGPNLAKDSIKTQPLTNEYFTPGHPYYFRRPWKLYHEDQRNAASRQGKSSKGNNALEKLVKAELGSSAIKWLKKAASLFGGGGADLGAGAVDSTRIPGAPGSWTKSGTQAHNIAKDVYTSALALGLDAKHAAAMVGNAWHESAGFEYGLKVNQFGGGGGKGLFQFTGQPSKYGWSPYAQDKSILSNATPGQESGWKHESGSPYKLAEDFETIFERGSIPAYAARAEAAETAYHMFAANGGWADKNNMRIFGEAGPEVAINPARDTADHLIVQAIGARMRHSPNSPIAGLVKSLGIRHKASSLADDIKDLIVGSANPKPKRNNNKIDIHLSIGNINISGNPTHQQASNLTHNIEKLVERGVQRAALRSRNRLDW